MGFYVNDDDKKISCLHSLMGLAGSFHARGLNARVDEVVN